jgi:hypothetical protein
MTEEQDKKPSVDDMNLAMDGRSVDWYLQSLVSTVNTTDVQFGITLFVEGAIISGLLIGGKKYFETFANEFAGAFPGDDEAKETIRQSFASYAEIYTSEESADLPPPQFIHLLDSRCFSPGGKPLPGNRGVLWRGKINAVSGFSLGSLSAE